MPALLPSLPALRATAQRWQRVSSLKVLGVPMEPFPNVLRWNASVRTLPCVRADLDHVKRSAIEKFAPGASPYEAEKVVWRGGVELRFRRTTVQPHGRETTL